MPEFLRVGQSTTSFFSNTERKLVRVPPYVDSKGYVQNAGFTHQPIPELEKGAIDGPKAIVLHRTDSFTSDSALQAFRRGVGTHFLIDKDGTVFQTASLLRRTHHVGKIKSRCLQSGTPAAEAAMLRSWGWAPDRIYDHEKRKSYPERYPMNEDSVGIETVAKHLGEDGWEPPTAQQSTSIAAIVHVLQEAYGLGGTDIYEHDLISYKTEGEGADLYE